jgi:hypothetical protein
VNLAASKCWPAREKEVAELVSESEGQGSGEEPEKQP